jgi:hypothetical protein
MTLVVPKEPALEFGALAPEPGGRDGTKADKLGIDRSGVSDNGGEYVWPDYGLQLHDAPSGRVHPLIVLAVRVSIRSGCNGTPYNRWAIHPELGFDEAEST